MCPACQKVENVILVRLVTILCQNYKCDRARTYKAYTANAYYIPCIHKLV